MMSDNKGTTVGGSTGRGVEIRNRDMLALKRYITSKDDVRRDGMSATTIFIDLTHSNLQQKHIEIRFDKKYDTLYDVKLKIHQKTGTPPQYQSLQIKCMNQLLFDTIRADDTSKDQYKLGYFFPDFDETVTAGSGTGYEIHCIDINPISGSSNGQYENVELVTKYRMTEDDYEQRKGTLRDWSKQQSIKDPNFTLAKHAKEHREYCEAKRYWKLNSFPLPYHYVVDSTGNDIIKEFDDDDENNHLSTTKDTADTTTTNEKYNESSIEYIVVGSRCQVQPGSRRGVVSYVGTVPELEVSSSYWVGVTFDEPVGKTDGSVVGKQKGDRTATKKQYFDALPKYGSFVRGNNVEIGNYPEIDDCLLDSDDDSEDEL